MHMLRLVQFSSLQSISHTQLRDPMDCIMPDSPVLYNLLEFAQTHVHWVWCHPIISSSVAPFSSCPQSFPAIGSFPLSWLFGSGSQSIGASASVTVLPMNIQDWFPLGLIGLTTSLVSKGLSEVFSSTQFNSINSSVLILLYCPTITSGTWLLEKP